ncbi:MAG TPA: BTAD domain-containing putative transcriptional regulator [Gemmatimonadaceae bacterium]
MNSDRTNGLTLRVLGGLEISGSNGAESLATQPKRAALLLYLAVARPGGFHRRDRLVTLFWPEHDQEHARAALRKALHALRQVVGDDVVVTRGDEEIGVSPSVWCDASAFLVEAGQEHYARALELYRGDLLSGFFADAPGFERWMEEERVFFRDMAGSCAWALAERYATSSDLTSATRWARRAVNLAPTDERRLRKALSLLHQAGDRAGAVKLFDDFARRLHTELDIEPSHETQALMRQIRGK